MKTLIVDNESNARTTLKNLLSMFCPEVEIVGEASSVSSALQFLAKNSVDILLLNIEMKDINGLNLPEGHNSFPINTIFTTTPDSWGDRAFHYHPCEFLLKPIVPADLRKAINHIRSKIKSSNAGIQKNWGLLEESRLAIHTIEGITFLPISQIIRVESDGHYTTFFLLDGDKAIASKGIKAFEAFFPAHVFYRIHQSHIIQLKYVRKFLKIDGFFALLTNGDKIPVARRKKDGFLGKLLGGPEMLH